MSRAAPETSAHTARKMSPMGFPAPNLLAGVVLAASLAQILSGGACQVILSRLPFGRRASAELATNKVFRRMDSPGMTYVTAGAPFVSTLLFLFAYHTLGCAPAVTPLRAALVMWLCGACHGVFIDHCSIRYSLDVAAFFAASTCAGAAVMGWTVQYAYERYA